MTTYPFPTLTSRVPLEHAFERIVKFLDLDVTNLMQYAEEDTIGGYHHEPDLQKYKAGIWGVEGQVVYALIRALQPQHVLEIGMGVSTLHIAAALAKNGSGKLTTVDTARKKRLPKKYQTLVRYAKEDLFEFNYKGRPLYDFCFEDGEPHSRESVGHVWKEFLTHGKKGAVIVSHDSEHFNVGRNVQAGIREATADYLSVAIHPADCGLAIGKKV